MVGNQRQTAAADQNPGDDLSDNDRKFQSFKLRNKKGDQKCEQNDDEQWDKGSVLVHR